MLQTIMGLGLRMVTMMPEDDIKLKVINKDDSCTCGTKSCAAVRHVEDVGHQVDQLELRVERLGMELRKSARDMWFRLGLLGGMMTVVLVVTYGLRWSIDII